MAKKIFILGVAIIMALGLAVGLAGCNTFDLEQYKADAKAELDSYAQANYREENWTAIQNIVANTKTSIDGATSKVQIDKIVVAAKEAIDKVEAERIKPMDGAEEYSSGNGTENAPYIIGTKGQLIHFSNQINSGKNTNAYFILSADIDLDGMEWVPAGIITASYNGGNCFYGVFDGKGYEVSNFCITARQKNTRAENIGLFGYNAGTIRNLGAVDFDIDISWSYEFGYGWSVMSGGLAGSNFGNIANCFAIGNINLAYQGGATITSPSHIFAGGLVGNNGNNGSITNCYTAVEVNAEYSNEAGTTSAGGLAGATNGTIENCLVTGNVSISCHSSGTGTAGALFGEITGATKQNCYWYEGLLVNGATSNVLDVICSALELNNPTFYTGKLSWNIDDWDFDDLNFSDGKFIDGKYPKLIQK